MFRKINIHLRKYNTIIIVKYNNVIIVTNHMTIINVRAFTVYKITYFFLYEARKQPIRVLSSIILLFLLLILKRI